MFVHKDFNRHILDSQPASILDVGCGTGRYYEWATKWGISYAGVDVDPEVIKKAILKYKTDCFHLIDGISMPMLSDKSFDSILLIEVIEHIENLKSLEALIKECMRIAKRNIFFTTPNCSDEEFLVSHKLIYNHYTHSVGQGFNFKYDDSHKHHLRFTKESLSGFLGTITPSYIVEEKVPLDIRSTREPDRILYYKLWGIINC